MGVTVTGGFSAATGSSPTIHAMSRPPERNLTPIPPTQLVGPPVEGLTSVEVDLCISIYDSATERMFSLNQTASDIWRLSSGEHVAREIVELLAFAYGVSATDIADDVLATIARFRTEGLVVLRAEDTLAL